MKQPDRLKSVAQRRYYMNRILKEEQVDIDTKTRTITLPYKCFKDIPVGLRFYIGQCIILRYNVQYEIEGSLKANSAPKAKTRKKMGEKKINLRKVKQKVPVLVVTNQMDLFSANRSF